MSVALRRGLPRVPGGEPWPPADAVGPDTIESVDAVTAAPVAAAAVPSAPVEAAAVSESAAEPVPAAAPAAAAGAAVSLRRGLPRVPGGEPWPPAGDVQVADAASVAAPVAAAVAAAPAAPAAPAAEAPAAAPTASGETETVALRRGLPRTAGGPAWPEVATAEVPARVAAAPVVAVPAEQPARETPAAAAEPEQPKPEQPQPAPKVSKGAVEQGVDKQAPKEEARKYGRYTAGGWVWRAAAALLALLVLGAMAVMSARYLVEGTAWGRDFVARYPGEQPLPDWAPVGLPWWLNWAHFFNMFLMILIIKTGLQVRREQKPEGYWTPPWNSKKKISITLWLHQALDVLWLVNGLIFFVLIFATGHWVRIVPTSWETFPNALSAGLQYLTLNWPLENGWVHYNSLQELAYFTTVFIATPLAIVSGLRMSSFWNDAWDGANKIMPAAAARKIHFPVVIYYMVFIVIHVLLVFATGARRNLAGMFAARGDVDPTVYANSWIGVIMLLVALAVTAAAWFLLRPTFVAPVANLTGKVSNR